MHFKQEETKAKIQSVLEHLCGEDCKLEIYQKDNTDEIIVSGDSIEGLLSCCSLIAHTITYKIYLQNITFYIKEFSMSNLAHLWTTGA